MYAVDTNILVRFLVRDDERQAQKVYRLFLAAEKENRDLYIPVTVILELLWVLASAYKISRNDIIDSIEELTLMPIFRFENLDAIQHSLRDARKNTNDLPDLLIGHCARQKGCQEVLTFDKKAAKHSPFSLL